MNIIHDIPLSHQPGSRAQVYAKLKNYWYEWRIIDEQRIVCDAKLEGSGRLFAGRQYEEPDRALRDALMFASGLEIEGDARLGACREKEHKSLINWLKEGKSLMDAAMARAFRRLFLDEPSGVPTWFGRHFIFVVLGVWAMLMILLTWLRASGG